MAHALTLPVTYDDGSITVKSTRKLPRGHGEGVIVITELEKNQSKIDKKKGFDFGTLSAFGMWKDRKDLKDSVSYVNEMRRKIGSRRI